MRTILPHLYVVREADKERNTLRGQLWEWTFAWLVAAFLALLIWMVNGQREVWWLWLVVGLWFSWFWVRSGWVHSLWEELEDEERELLGPGGEVAIARRATLLWGLVVLGVAVRAVVVWFGGWDEAIAGIDALLG